jgi:acetyltransferase-like isoleucine patch superfamily enzyme
MAFCGRWVLGVFGRDFAGAEHAVLWLLLASTVLESIFLGCYQAIQTTGRMWMALGAIVIPWQGVFLITAYLLIPRFGAGGLAAAYLAGIGTALLATVLATLPAAKEKSGMTWRGKFSELLRLTNWLRTQYRVRRNPVAYARSIGGTIGEGTHLYGGDSRTFGSEPYLVTIGKNCHITNEVRFITHDGMSLILRARHPDIDLLEPIEVGDNVAIGMRSIILPGVRIGSNCIVGCASVVNRDVADNTVVAGVPARVIGTIEDYERRVVGRSLRTGALDGREKEQRLREIFAVGQAGRGH